MAALLDLHPDSTHPVLSGVAEVHAVLDRMHADARRLEPGQQRSTWRRSTARSGASRPSSSSWSRPQTHAGVAKDAGFTGADAWLAKTTTVSRADAARQVALAGELESGHDATAEALDAGLVSPEHAAVIVRATGQLPDGVSAEQRQTVEASLVEKATRFSPDQLRRIARRAIEDVEPDQTMVDAHENELIRTEEQAAREKCSLTLHDNGDGTTTGHFTIPALAAAMLGKVIDAMTAPRRMRAGSSRPFLRLAAPPRTRVRRAARAPAHRPPALKERGHRGRHHRPHRPGRRTQGSPPRHRPGTLGRRSPPARLQRRHPPGRPRRQVRRPRPRSREPAVLRVPTGGQGARAHDLRCQRLRTPLRLVRAAPPTTLGPRRSAPTWPNAIPLCHQHHHWIHDTGFNHETMPDGSVRFSRRT